MSHKGFRLTLAVFFLAAALPPPAMSWVSCCPLKAAESEKNQHLQTTPCCCCQAGGVDRAIETHSSSAPNKQQPNSRTCVKWCCVGFVPLTVAADVPLEDRTPEAALPCLLQNLHDGFRPRIEHPPRTTL